MANLNIGFTTPKPTTFQKRRITASKFIWILSVLTLSAFVASWMTFYDATFSPHAWIILTLVVYLIIYNPRYAIYLVIFLSILGDGTTTVSYPFNLNFSSRQSLLYIGNNVIINPIELCVGVGILSWLIQGAVSRKLEIKVTSTLLAGAVFIIFVTIGIGYGLGVRNGDVNIGLWESRPMFYLFGMLLLTTQLFTSKDHIMNLLWAAFLGMFIEGIFSINYVANVLNWNIGSVETIVDHSAAIQINMFLAFMVSAWFFQKTSLYAKFVPFLLMVPILFTYIGAQRRTAFLTLGIFMAVIFLLLFLYRRNIFWLVVPPSVVFGVLYIGAFWNVQGPAGLPAQAVKSVIAEDEATQKDRNSNLYRITENLNALYTIKRFPWFGVGFGNKFLIAYPLPDISHFEWWEYFTHNSIIWMWMQMGVFGFLSTIYLIALGIMIGARAITFAPPGDLRVAAIALAGYVMMHFIYAYVDISWDGESMLLIGASIGTLNRIAIMYGEESKSESTELAIA